MDGRQGSGRRATERFLLVVDPLPLRLRGLAATELPVTAAAVADLAAGLAARGAALGRLAYVLAEHDWDLNFTGNFMLEARCICRRVELERLLAGQSELASAATVYLEAGLLAAGQSPQHELFWAEDESRLVAA